jgi:hypothetical protein
VLQGNRQVAGLVKALGDDPRQVPDVARGAVELVDQMLGKGRRRILNSVKIKSFLATG